MECQTILSLITLGGVRPGRYGRYRHRSRPRQAGLSADELPCALANEVGSTFTPPFASKRRYLVLAICSVHTDDPRRPRPRGCRHRRPQLGVVRFL